ncbi:MAG TPA: hypothetical protein VG388_09440 [Solirubrobacteraceae bacterium]|jgi:hypothetical protein|nr:hypothetical protein [Solirubrobacteraceae bacterium]
MIAPSPETSTALVAALRAEGGTVAELTCDQDPSCAPSEPARLAAAGPRARGFEAEYELLVEMIFEGCRLHYGPQRVVRTADQDLALLLGDQLYALGLARLARIGDLEAIAELADVISLVAQAYIAQAPELADAVWVAGAVAIGWGTDARHAQAKELARTQDPAAAGALRDVADSRSAAVAGRHRPS